MRSALLVPVLLIASLAGCADDAPAPEPEAAAPDVITDPTMGLNDTGAHIHDYWGGGDRVTVVDATHPGGDEPGTGPGLASGQDVVVRTFQPEPGDVVPQGTVAMEVTLSWVEDELDSYTAPSLWLKTAGTNATTEVAQVENGVPVTLEANAPDADLPHQVLSAWLFELRMGSPDPAPLRFKGAVTLKAEALRGDEPLPLFPAHPDRWNGTNELPLLQAGGQLSYWQDTGDGGCNGLSCPQVLRPASGAIVPHDAAYVRVELTVDSPTTIALQLLYHTALAREFDTVAGESAGGTVTFQLPLLDGGDGPYATQSQWEFTVVPAETGAVRTAWFADYTITATAVK